MAASHRTIRSSFGNETCWKQIGVFGDGTCPELTKVVHCRNCPTFASAGEWLFERKPPAEYLAEWGKKLAADPGATEEDCLAAVLFRVANEWFALSVHVVVEICAPRPIRKIPHRCDALLQGLVNIRGELQLCVEPKTFLELTGDATSETTSPGSEADSATARLLVIQGEKDRWVLRVDEVAGVARIGRGSVANVPSTVGRSRHCFTQAVFPWNDQKVGYLDHQVVLKSLERAIG